MNPNDKPTRDTSITTPTNPLLYHQPSSRKLLLDEESAQMRQLPRARNTEHNQLHDRPPHHPRIRRLRLIPKLRLSLLLPQNTHAHQQPTPQVKDRPPHIPKTHPLKNLLPSNILQSRIKVLDLLHDILNLALIRTLNRARLPDREVEIQPDAAGRVAAVQPAARGGGRRRGEADLVVAGVGGAEGEAAGAGAALRNDAVVVVEGLVDGDGDAEVGVRAEGVGGGVVLVGFVVACGRRVSGG